MECSREDGRINSEEALEEKMYITVGLDNVNQDQSFSCLCSLLYDFLRYKSYLFRFYFSFVNFWVVLFLLLFNNSLTVVKNDYVNTIWLETRNNTGNNTGVYVNFTVSETTHFGYDGCRSDHNIYQRPSKVQFSHDVSVTLFYCDVYCADYWSSECEAFQKTTINDTRGIKFNGELSANLYKTLTFAANVFIMLVSLGLCFCGFGFIWVCLGMPALAHKSIGVVRVDIIFFLLTVAFEFVGGAWWIIYGNAAVDPDSPTEYDGEDVTIVIINDPFNGAGYKSWGHTIYGVFLMCIFMLISVLVSHLCEMYYKDYLTNLWSKAMLDIALRMWTQSYRLKRCQRKGKLVLFSIDVDNFGAFNNDFEDHAVGDRILKIVAGDMTKVTRNYNARTYRRSGDEFVVLGSFESINDAKKCGMELVTRVHRTINVKTHYKKEPAKDLDKSLSISVGMAAYEINDSVQDWTEIAEQMMYIAKGSSDELKKRLLGFNIDNYVKFKKSPKKDRLVWFKRDGDKGIIKVVPFKGSEYSLEDENKTDINIKHSISESEVKLEQSIRENEQKLVVNALEQFPKASGAYDPNNLAVQLARPIREKSRKLVAEALMQYPKASRPYHVHNELIVRGSLTSQSSVVLTTLSEPLIPKTNKQQIE
jgi:diguanylate cyclase (GGDEF)-like protein